MDFEIETSKHDLKKLPEIRVIFDDEKDRCWMEFPPAVRVLISPAGTRLAAIALVERMLHHFFPGTSRHVRAKMSRSDLRPS